MKPKTYFCPFHQITYDLTNNRIFFWKGILSQWTKTLITDEDSGVVYNTAEQAMMHHKALFFEDFEIAQKIMQTENPKTQKELGRQIKNYDDLAWKNVRLRIVSKINYWKFNQNRELKSLIVGLKDYEFVEANPNDKIWGIGMSIDDVDVYNSSLWQGENLLGQAIKNAQIRIINEL